MKTKTCTKCGETKPLSEFGKNKQSKDGKTYRCLQCKREYNAWFRKTPKGIYQQLKAQIKYSKKHKGERDHKGYIRGLRKDLLCTQDEFIQWHNSQEKVCIYCGIKEEELDLISDIWNSKLKRLSIDCRDNDKGYSVDNIVLSCGRCNLTKNDFFTFKEMCKIGKIIKKHWDADFIKPL